MFWLMLAVEIELHRRRLADRNAREEAAIRVGLESLGVGLRVIGKAMPS